jgi:hypothetical protein
MEPLVCWPVMMSTPICWMITDIWRAEVAGQRGSAAAASRLRPAGPGLFTS